MPDGHEDVLQLRALVGVGPRVTLLEQKQAGLVVGVAYMFEYQELDKKDGLVDAGRTESTNRLSSYLLFTSALNDVVTFVDTVYWSRGRRASASPRRRSDSPSP